MLTKTAISEKEKALCKSLDVPMIEMSTMDRLQQLMAFRNEWKLYPRKCDATGKQILSAYAADSPFKIYNNSYWWGDQWDAMSYGRDFDFNRPFFEQLRDLQLAVPREGTTIFSSENCEYNSHIRYSKNCFLCSLIYKCEDVYYSCWMVESKDVFDSYMANYSTLSYNCSNVNNAYQCVFIEESQNCNDCYFSFQIRGCDHCIFCSNLANKSYYAFNKPCSKEEFEKIKAQYLNGSWDSWQKGVAEYLKMRKNAIHRFAHNLNCENVAGDHLYDSKNCVNSFDGYTCEDCYDSISLADSKDVYGCYSAGWPGCENIYYSLVSRGSKFVRFSNYTWYSSDIWYCDSCNACDSCFGCNGLQHKKYCILNKQYSKEEYEQMITKIREHMKKTGEWGKFLPKEMYPFAYNETAALEYFPLTKEQAISQGWKWRDEDKKDYQAASISEIPDNIKDIPDTFTKEILKCDKCGKNFKLIMQELKFYRKIGLPVPRSCPDCRHKELFELINPKKLYSRNCAKCNAPIETTYAPEQPETVYCDKCYLDAIN